MHLAVRPVPLYSNQFPSLSCARTVTIDGRVTIPYSPGTLETALGAGLLAFGRDDDRVYKLKYLLVIFIFNIGFNDEDNTAQYADLRSHKADSVCIFKRFGHVVEKLGGVLSQI